MTFLVTAHAGRRLLRDHLGLGSYQTIVNLLMKFYELDKEVSVVDGVDTIYHEAFGSTRCLSMVLQDTCSLKETIREPDEIR